MLFLLCMKPVGRQVSLLKHRELAQRRIYIHSHWDGFLILLVFFALGCGMSSEVLIMYRGICTSYLHL